MVRLRINTKIYWLLLLVAALAVMLSPTHVLAQERKQGLSLRLTSGSYYNDVVRGEDNTFYLDVVNNNSQTITGVRFSSNNPRDWLVEFKPQSIDSISAGSYRTIDVNIKPPESASRGDYDITFIAESGEMRAVMSIFVRVEQGTSIWLWIGIAVAVVVVAGFVIVFMRFGRQ